MSRVPLGKVLLRNVIRHTDAHNKIQEESEMWKIRELEKQTQEIYSGRQRRVLSDCSSSRMRCDGFDDDSQRADWKAKNIDSISMTMEDDLLRARYWNKKLYDCEANMPDRWGHSGYKELYPEEFDSESDWQEREEQAAVNGKRKTHPGKQAACDSPKRKKQKKSHKKKQKKRSHKKRKKKKKEPARAASDSSQESESSEEAAPAAKKKKRKHKKRARNLSTREPASSSGQESDSSDASSSASGSFEDSDTEGKKERRKRRRRKRHPSASERHSEVPEKRSKRKNWKVAADEKSEDSSDED
uniref:NKAP domain containing 1 n=1 Tax=Sphenodon punctatus TaxID=8508 RepID=A0A8D0H0I9_SPHPU